MGDEVGHGPVFKASSCEREDAITRRAAITQLERETHRCPCGARPGHAEPISRVSSSPDTSRCSDADAADEQGNHATRRANRHHPRRGVAARRCRRLRTLKS